MNTNIGKLLESKLSASAVSDNMANGIINRVLLLQNAVSFCSLMISYIPYIYKLW